MVRRIGRAFQLGFSMLLFVTVIWMVRSSNGYKKYFLFLSTQRADDESAESLTPGEKDARSKEEVSTSLRPIITAEHNSSSQQNRILNHNRLEALMNEMLQSVSYMSDPVVDGIPTSADVDLLDGYKNPCWYNSSNELICMPYFFLGGFPKCGTTDLFSNLRQHPEILQGRLKEIHWWTIYRFTGSTFSCYADFFARTTAVINKTINAGNYHSMVATDGSVSTVWDNRFLMTSDYQLDPPPFLNIHVIHGLLPRAKFVLMIRNPVTRAYSDYLYFQKKNKSPEDFHSRVVDAKRMSA